MPWPYDPNEMFCRRAAGMFAELRAKLQVAARQRIRRRRGGTAAPRRRFRSTESNLGDDGAAIPIRSRGCADGYDVAVWSVTPKRRCGGPFLIGLTGSPCASRRGFEVLARKLVPTYA